ncbi:ROK family protein [Coriobacteriales bacterium OH1046]|nr:ROK family protein [Coriobacteriales bacterium OH1046]
MHSIGIDIGGTQLRVAALGQDGRLIAKQAVPNDRTLSPQENVGRLLDCIESWDLDYEGIGIGCPGPLDLVFGRILNPPNLLGWEGFDIVRFVEGRTSKRVMLDNDANVAGLAEALVGAGKGRESVFYLTVSTGVGGAYIYRGEIVRGANSCAAEVFNLMVNGSTDHRSGMNDGCLEDQASGTAIARVASRELGIEVDGAGVFALAHEGNEVALSVIGRAADALARGVANISFVVDPNIFVFGGSVALHNSFFIDLVHEKAKRYVLNPDTLSFALAQRGGDAGLVGAALMV